MEKCLCKRASRASSEEENANNNSEQLVDNDMQIVVQEELQRVFGEF